MKKSEGGRPVLKSQLVADLGPGELSGSRVSEKMEKDLGHVDTSERRGVGGPPSSVAPRPIEQECCP